MQVSLYISFFSSATKEKPLERTHCEAFGAFSLSVYLTTGHLGFAFLPSPRYLSLHSFFLLTLHSGAAYFTHLKDGL